MTLTNIDNKITKINTFARKYIGVKAIGDINVLRPSERKSELDFLRLVSWLYCIYFEAGKTSIKFIIRMSRSMLGKQTNDIEDIMENVRVLRTSLHHNIGFENDYDKKSRSRLNNWYKSAIQTTIVTEKNWPDCCSYLIDEANEFFAWLEANLQEIEIKNEIELSSKWKRCLNTDIEPISFDHIIENTKNMLGYLFLDTVKFRNKHLNNWRNRLESYDDEILADEDKCIKEIQKIVQITMLSPENLILPVDGEDLIEKYDLEKGPLIRKALEIVFAHFKENPCEKTKLLQDTESKILDLINKNK